MSIGGIGKVGGGLFDVGELYGQESFWSWTLGVRVGFGGGSHRMGRYGAAMGGGHLHQHRNEK